MLVFPRFVYRCPGPTDGGPGVTFDSKLTTDASEHSAALASGWFSTLPEACDPPKAAPVVPQAAPAAIPADDAPPTRGELEEQAKRLGLKPDGRWSDHRLAAAIADAMKG